MTSPLAALTPLTADEATISDARGQSICAIHGGSWLEDVATAAEIVRRVNAHDALVAALDGLLLRDEVACACDAPELGECDWHRWTTEARAALLAARSL